MVQGAGQDGQAASVLSAMGGKDNLSALEACVTRLRVTVKNPNLVDKAALRRLGAIGILEAGHNLQAIFGTRSLILKEQIAQIIGRQENGNSYAMEYLFYAPLSGEVIDLSAVPDQVFAEKMLGDGFAIKPADGLVLSPAAGKIVTAFSTKHAVALLTRDGLEILIHVGVDTVKLKGEGFELLVKEGDTVEPGTPLLKADLTYINANAKSSITPVVFTNLKEQAVKVKETRVVAGQTVVCTVTQAQ